MTAEQSHQLLSTRILALFFPDIFDARSMVILDGEKGCGKTILAYKVGWLIRGSRFNVSGLPDKREDMETLLTGEVFAVLDNLDEPAAIRKYTQILCQAVTGGKINKRQLYTTNSSCRIP